MRMRFLRLLFIPLAMVLVSCSVPGLAQPTPPPVIIIATPVPTASGAGVPTAAPAAPLPSPTTATGPATSPTTPAAGQTATGSTTTTSGTATTGTKGTITLAFESFPSYLPSVLMDVKGLLKQRGYNLKLVPLGLNGQNVVTEEQRYQKLKSGEWDVLPTTLNSFARRASPDVGAITSVIDESAGVDKIDATPVITTINDLKGKRISFSQGSVSEYLLYYALSLAGLGPKDVTLVPKESVDDAVKAYTDGQADAVVGYVPNIAAAEQHGAKTVIASDKLRAILDVLVTSRPALTNKADAVQAFHDAWYDALRLMIDQPNDAEQALISWGNNDWTGIAKPGDLKASLQGIAQATLNANQIAFQQPDLLVSRLREAQGIWTQVGQAPPQADLTQLVDGRFTLASAHNPALFTSQSPVDSSFLLTAKVNLPPLSSQEQQGAQPVVKLPLEKIDFEPDSVRLTPKAQNDITTQILPVLRSSRLYLKIDGSAAWPGPAGQYTQDDIRSFAKDRATSVATFLAQQGIDPNRLIIGTLDPKFPNSTNENELAQDRIVRFTLITTGGR